MSNDAFLTVQLPPQAGGGGGDIQSNQNSRASRLKKRDAKKTVNTTNLLDRRTNMANNSIQSREFAISRQDSDDLSSAEEIAE